MISRNTPHRFAGSVSIPLQQTVMVLSSNGKVSATDKKFLYQIITLFNWASRYAPFIVDPLKMGKGDPTEFGFYRSPKLPDPLVRLVTHYYKYIGNSIGSAGTSIWLLLSFCLLLLILPKYILIVLPMLLNWLTVMISAFIAFAFRYVLYYLFAFPVLLALFPLIVQTSATSHREVLTAQ
ncbi:hypothetical protein [Pseudoramibacter faecis]|uniref:hypothetical protein n=1 Tax=Pseudoramibacter faecis TaxID=3108534 RepID=UPI002E784154|nr:hypothetical protein [Pseudoramibacter sp. HA2172]